MPMTAWLPSLVFAAVLVLAAHSAPEAQLLNGDTVVKRELSGAQSHLYRISLETGQYAGLIVDQRGVDVVVQLVDSTSKMIAEYDSEPRLQGQESVAFVAASAREYQLKIAARYPKAAAGSYELRVVELRQATDRDRAIFEAHKLSTEASGLEEEGKYDQAMALAEHALSVEQQALGPSDAYTAFLLYRIASLKRIKGNVSEGELMFNRAIAACEKAVGRENPLTALALGGLGRLYMADNQYAKAGVLLEEQNAILERTLGSDHPQLAGGLRAIAVLHAYLSDFERAETRLQRATRIAEKTLEPSDVTAIAIVHDLGYLYWRMGANRRAEPILQRELAIVERSEER